MRRRDLLSVLGAAAAWPRALAAQETKPKLRVGCVVVNPRTNLAIAAFEARMAELGYRDGATYAFDFVRVPSFDHFAAGYRDLMTRKPDVILTTGPEYNLQSAVAASPDVPIVMIAVDFDPLARGYVPSLASPGGRITGLYLQQIELVEKRVELFREAFPALTAAAAFWDRISADQWQAAERRAARLGLALAGVDLGAPPFDYDRALAGVPPTHRPHLFMLASPFFFQDRERLAAFALRSRTASMFSFHEHVEAGGLFSYGPSVTGMFRRAADVVDRIAQGAKIRDLPIEQPTRFELTVNLATARSLDLELPPLLLARADRIIE